MFIITVHGNYCFAPPVVLDLDEFYPHYFYFFFALLHLPLLLTFVPLFPHRLTVGRNGRREDANSSEGG